MAGYRVPFLVGTTRGRDFQMWPTVEDPLFTSVLTEGTPIPRTEDSWGARDLTWQQLLAISSRISEWRFAGGWSDSYDFYTEPGHVYASSIATVNSFVGSPIPIAVFAKCTNDLATFTIPVVKEPHLVFQNFGPKIFSPLHKDYAHDFDQPTAGYAYHSYGLVNSSVGATGAAPFDAVDIHSEVDDGVGPPASSDNGSLFFGMFRDFLTSFLFANARGVDMVRFKPLGTSGPSGPVDAFDVYLTITASNSATFNYSFIDSAFGSSNAFITIDPVIAPAFSVPVHIGGVAPVGESATQTSLDCDITITATKFFEYADSQGNPVYDINTGAQLNDPFG